MKVSKMIDENQQREMTGTLIAYYYICKRKLWLHAKGLNLENISGNVDVIKGKILHENSYKRESRKEYGFDRTKIDFLQYGDEIIIHEIKKSKKFEEAHIWQIKYYIYTLKSKGVKCSTGVIHYPNNMQTVDVEFNYEDEESILLAINEIREILEYQKPPEPLGKRFCKNCAYFDFCFA